MKKLWLFVPPAILLALLIYACTRENDSSGSSNIKGANGSYVVFAWNDLGMHCLNPSYDTAVILPPYNTLMAQVVKRAENPEIVKSGIRVEYRVINNTYSYGKRKYSGFWDHAVSLFGRIFGFSSLPQNTGLMGNSLSGEMVLEGDHYIAKGIPVTPVDDNNQWNPYQVAEVVVKDLAGNVLIKTEATVPTSDEINCGKCHGANAFNDILVKHDAMHGTNLVNSEPVLCSSCHGDPALGGTSAGVKYLSEAIHSSHANRQGITCYDCHPGNTTKCSRSLAHTATDGNCTTCHGSMSEVASSITTGRTPWSGEPQCATCHTNVSGVNTGMELYRNSRGHGNMYCTACHGSPHAMVPSRENSDNYQAIQYMGKAKTIGSCGVCHSSSRGGGSPSDFTEVHAGLNPEHQSACNVCHTSVPANDGSGWPHAFQWKDSGGVPGGSGGD